MESIIIENSVVCSFKNGILTISVFDDAEAYQGHDGWQEIEVDPNEGCHVCGINMGCYGNTYAPENGVVFHPETSTLVVWQSNYVGQFGNCNEETASTIYKVDFKNQNFIYCQTETNN